MAKTTIWYVEYVPNEAGYWDKQWFATEREAQEFYDGLVAGDYDPDSAKCGEYGDIETPSPVTIEFAKEALVKFCNIYACQEA